MTLEELQQVVDRWITTYGVRYFDPMTNMAVLTEEVGEVARIMARLYGEQSAKPGEVITTDRLADELADLLWVITCIANQTGCDLTAAIDKNIAKKTERDKTRHIANSKLRRNE
ncbi:MAG: nucleotide pyrophosphohydrolase [Porphyromonas sp.]|nr:nucleotide pyrophosphohydrolase [Porphyromonas sp.]